MAGPRILILTASFGDGHNSAARGLAAALRPRVGEDFRVDVRDFIRETQPMTGRLLEQLYRFSITRAPWTWRQFYRAAGKVPASSDPGTVLRPLARALMDDLRRDPPAAIAVTFPLYPHLLRRLGGPAAAPVFTLVTDSITIHPIWKCEGVRAYFAPDETSAAQLRHALGAGVEVDDTGFAVAPVFNELPAQPPADTPRRVLIFPAASRRLTQRTLDSLFTASPPECEFTVVLGRQADHLGAAVAEVRARFPQRRADVLGWVDNVPELMTGHDLIIAKAGGATTHECGAAGRPVILTKVVPGQEEGNAELVQRRGSGLHEEDPEDLGPLLRQLKESGDWLRLRDAAWRYRRPDGALSAADHLLSAIGYSKNRKDEG